MSSYHNTLTIVIRNDTPLIHCNSSPSYRSVTIQLTPEQMGKISLWQNEDIANCFLEPKREEIEQ